MPKPKQKTTQKTWYKLMQSILEKRSLCFEPLTKKHDKKGVSDLGEKAQKHDDSTACTDNDRTHRFRT